MPRKQSWSVHPALQLLVTFIALAGLRQLQLASRSSSASQAQLQDASTGTRRASTAEFDATVVNQQPKNECEDFVSLAAADGHVVDAAALHDGVILSGSITEEDAYSYYQVCIARHQHHHRIIVRLECTHGEADLYISANGIAPTAENSDWLSAQTGADEISLPTYTDTFTERDSQLLVIGVHGTSVSDAIPFSGTSYTLSVHIANIDSKEVRSRLPLTSTGRVL
eukprot:16798-Heterococcus_DN1.PRE.4